MKKKFPILIGTVLLSACLAACGSKNNPQEVIGSVKTNMESTASMDFDIHTVSDIITTYEDTKVIQKTESNLNVKETASTAYITGEILSSIGNSNNKYTVEAYQTTANENYSLYFNEDGNWYRQDTKDKKAFDMQILKMFYDAGVSFNEQTVMVNDKECLQVSADVYSENAQEFANLFGITTSEDAKIGVTAYIYKDLNYPAYIKVDFKQAAKQVVKNEEMNVVINNMYIELTFNSFNETEVALPEDIKKDAKKKQDETSTIQEQEKPQEVEVTEPEPEVPDINPTTSFEEEEEQVKIEELSKEWNSMQFEYEGSIYRMPMAYTAFEPSGFVMMENERTMIIEAGQVYTTTLYKGDYSVIVKIKNMATTPKTLYECDIVSVDFDTYSLDSDQLAKFMFPNNINFAALYSNIVESWGEPTNLHDGEALKIATYQDDENRIEIFFEPGTDKIIEYKITSN